MLLQRALAHLRLLAVPLFQDPAPPKPPSPPQYPLQEQLEKPPRHHGWIEIQRGERVLHCVVGDCMIKDLDLPHSPGEPIEWSNAA